MATASMEVTPDIQIRGNETAPFVLRESGITIDAPESRLGTGITRIPRADDGRLLFPTYSKVGEEVLVLPIELSADDAMLMSAESKYDSQRKLNVRHGDYLAGQMRSDNFKPFTDIELAILKDDPYGHAYLVDGQHRVYATITSGTTQRFMLKIYYVDTMDQVAQLYYRTDRGRGRTTRDTFSVFNLSETLGLSKPDQDNMGSAIRVLMSGFDRATVSTPIKIGDELLLQAITDLAPDARAFFESLEGGDTQIIKMLRRAPVLAVALITVHFVPNGSSRPATDFWRSVAQNDGLTKGSPEHTLVSFLHGNLVQRLGANVYARKVAYCWNQWVRQNPQDPEPVTKLYGNPNRPIEIAGTPYAGRRVVLYTPPGQFI